MAKEEMFLPEMERLEIEPLRVCVERRNENPFGGVGVRVRPALRRLAPARCACARPASRRSTPFKRPHRTLLKEPVLKLEGKAVLQANKSNFVHLNLECTSRCPLQTLNLETLNVCALVENDTHCELPVSAPSWRESERGGGGGGGSRGAGPSCSQQALNPPCDVTIDELASYFETLVHIPKKMSTMAEMMYI